MANIKRAVKKVYQQLVPMYYSLTGLVKGVKVECNICHFKANKFASNDWHLYANCPSCGSGVRQRLIFAALTFLDHLSFDKLIKNKKVLHFAPEKSLGKVFRSNANVYKSADFLTEGYAYDNLDYNIDISNMQQIESDSFDSVIACDVLEHVLNHINGIKEVYRVLRKGGHCIFTVPQKDHLEKTFEDYSITSPREREKIFGQADHLRIYGSDFVDMLQNCGFEVETVDENSFDRAIAEKYVLFPPILSKHPLATNYRKVFFGKKPAPQT